MRQWHVVLGVVLLLAVTATAAEHPVDKGSAIINGTVFFQSMTGEAYENFEGDGVTVLAAAPAVGFFVAPGVVIGGEFGYVDYSVGDESLSAFGVGPTVGYYFNSDPFRPEARGAAYPYVKGFFKYGKLDPDSDDPDDAITQTTFGGQAGVVYMISNAVGLDLGVRIQSDTIDEEEADSESVSGTVLWFGAGITAFAW
jgi:hypothetical protein